MSTGTLTLPEVGTTPLACFDGVYAKLECTNPSGSIKDRIGRYMMLAARERGELRPGQWIIEATSGNTGIAMSFFARELGHPITIVMPEHMTEERKDMMRSLGADLVLCSEEGSFAEAAAIRDRLAAENGWFNPDQFSNPLNAECHELTTGEEIVRQIGERRIDAFVAGVGTGGTVIGVGRRLRRANPNVQVVAVEPSESAVMSGGPAGAHFVAARRLLETFRPWSRSFPTGSPSIVRKGSRNAVSVVARSSTISSSESGRSGGDL